MSRKNVAPNLLRIGGISVVPSHCEQGDTHRKSQLMVSRRMVIEWICSFACLAVLAISALAQSLPNDFPLPDATGWLSTHSTAGKIDLTNEFFQSLGTNGRSCVTCHMPTEAWTITPADVQFRFFATGGTEPVFRPVDGANCPSADVSTVQARQVAYSQPHEPANSLGNHPSRNSE